MPTDHDHDDRRARDLHDQVAELLECAHHLCESMRALAMRHGDATMMYPGPAKPQLSQAEMEKLRQILNG